MDKILKYCFLLIICVCGISCTTKSNEWIIGVSQCSNDAWRTSMNNEIMREASFHPNLKINIKTAKDNSQKQIEDIESFISSDVDLLIISPNEAVPLTPVVEKAMDKNIPVILVDRKINSDKYTAFIGADNEQIGKEVGNYTVNLLNGKGNIIEMEGLESSTPAIERHHGFMSVIKNYPDIKITYSADGEWLKKQAEDNMENAFHLLKEPVNLVFAHNDEMALGVYDAYKNANIAKRPFIIGIDALSGANGGIQKVIDGAIDATFFYPTGGEKAVQTAVNILNHQPFERENILYTAVVDKTNARILKLQTDQISQHQNRIEQLNTVLMKNIAQYNLQRMMLIGSIIILLLFLLLLGLLMRAYKGKSRTNKILENQNIEINKQKKELSESRDQLLTLSKNLEESTQAKLVFFTNISHEFRTPLTLIMGPLQNLKEKEDLSKEGKKMVDVMSKNVNILLKLIEQILDFRKYENGKMQMNFTLSDLKSFIQAISDSFIEFAKKKHIHFNIHFSDDDFTLWFDIDKMKEIYYNLLSNAFKFTPENGKIEVSLSKIKNNKEDFVKIIVIDSGIGISETHINKIFDRFYKIDKRSSGSGIGLNLTKMLVELHNGTVQLESAEGKGTTVTVLLPYKQKDIAVTEQYPILKSSYDLENEWNILDSENEYFEDDLVYKDDKPMILLVEDNLDLRKYMRGFLNEEYHIIEANNGQSGLIKALKYVPELIISDVIMNVMDGFELCRQLKNEISTSHIPIILLTASPQEEHKMIGFESGADAYIAKPFNESILKIRIKKTIENRQRLKEYFNKNLTFGERKEGVADLDRTFIKKFTKIVEEKLIDTELNVDEIGKEIGLSRVQLYRKIKSLTNYAPNELIRIIRLKVAEDLILKTEKTISEIAYETGFSSPSYFSKCFKEYFSESPSEYMNKIKLN